VVRNVESEELLVHMSHRATVQSRVLVKPLHVWLDEAAGAGSIGSIEMLRKKVEDLDHARMNTFILCYQSTA
jgi:hypothetical protein